MTCISENVQHASKFLRAVHYWKRCGQWLLVVFVFSGHWFMMVLLPLMVVLVKVLLVAMIRMPCKLTQITWKKSRGRLQIRWMDLREKPFSVCRCCLPHSCTPPSESALLLSFSMLPCSACTYKSWHLTLCSFLYHCKSIVNRLSLSISHL